MKRIHDIDTKDIYWHLMTEITEQPTSENKWQEKTDLELTEEVWTTIYTLSNGLTRDTTILNLQFKITHRILACGYNLKIWKIKESNKCEFCNESIDTIEHFMIQCEAVDTFWRYVLN
jgi:predicted Zn-ribbon and HTH transcriptional regulator